MRVVLLHPPQRDPLEGATPKYVDQSRGHNPPMGLLYLQAAVERSAHESVFLDADLEGWTYEEAAREALGQNPDLIGARQRKRAESAILVPFGVDVSTLKDHPRGQAVPVVAHAVAE